MISLRDIYLYRASYRRGSTFKNYELDGTLLGFEVGGLFLDSSFGASFDFFSSSARARCFARSLNKFYGGRLDLCSRAA